MPKLILTADEEFMYLHQLEKMMMLMPDLEIKVLSDAPMIHKAQTQDSAIADQFRDFLKQRALKSRRESSVQELNTTF